MVMHFQWETLSDGVWRCRLPFCDVSVGLVRGSRGSLLIDCGLFQGLKALREQNWKRLSVKASTIHAVVLTHAHLDHCCLLPMLADAGVGKRTGPLGKR